MQFGWGHLARREWVLVQPLLLHDKSFNSDEGISISVDILFCLLAAGILNDDVPTPAFQPQQARVDALFDYDSRVWKVLVGYALPEPGAKP
jgi:hypothetical protein